jgi:hypothetical protein
MAFILFVPFIHEVGGNQFLIIRVHSLPKLILTPQAFLWLVLSTAVLICYFGRSE